MKCRTFHLDGSRRSGVGSVRAPVAGPRRTVGVLVEAEVVSPTLVSRGLEIDLSSAEVSLVADHDRDIGGRVTASEEAERLVDQREVFRRRAAACLDGYGTSDLGPARFGVRLEEQRQVVGARVLDDKVE